MVCAFADEDRNEARSARGKPSDWTLFAVYSGATLQLAGCIVGLGFLGHVVSLHVHRLWPTVAGVVLGVIAGVSGLTFLVKQVLGDRQ
ncbi:MAG: hypothetical protein K6T76_11225 [Alicyclobacillus mali]|nr:hypothetical protein [Alicyclobacillus mali (ex Roth et al. 2021)]